MTSTQGLWTSIWLKNKVFQKISHERPCWDGEVQSVHITLRLLGCLIAEKSTKLCYKIVMYFVCLFNNLMPLISIIECLYIQIQWLYWQPHLAWSLAPSHQWSYSHVTTNTRQVFGELRGSEAVLLLSKGKWSWVHYSWTFCTHPLTPNVIIVRYSHLWQGPSHLTRTKL